MPSSGLLTLTSFSFYMYAAKGRPRGSWLVTVTMMMDASHVVRCAGRRRIDTGASREGRLVWVAKADPGSAKMVWR
jgi:hypothetical protein